MITTIEVWHPKLGLIQVNERDLHIWLAKGCQQGGPVEEADTIEADENSPAGDGELAGEDPPPEASDVPNEDPPASPKSKGKKTA